MTSSDPKNGSLHWFDCKPNKGGYVATLVVPFWRDNVGPLVLWVQGRTGSSKSIPGRSRSEAARNLPTVQIIRRFLWGETAREYYTTQRPSTMLKGWKGVVGMLSQIAKREFRDKEGHPHAFLLHQWLFDVIVLLRSDSWKLDSSTTCTQWSDETSGKWHLFSGCAAWASVHNSHIYYIQTVSEI